MSKKEPQVKASIDLRAVRSKHSPGLTASLADDIPDGEEHHRTLWQAHDALAKELDRQASWIRKHKHLFRLVKREAEE